MEEIPAYTSTKEMLRQAFSAKGARDSILLMQTIDISRYLKKGENIIAVWYAPGRIRNKSKQLSLELHGWYTDSVPFYHKADETWWCKPLKGGSYNEKEHFDNRIYTTEWKSAEYQSSGWFIRQVLSKIQQTISLLTSYHTSPRTSFKWY